MTSRVEECQNLIWPFHGGPRLRTVHGNEYVDPFPCYAHDAELVGDQLERVESYVDILCKPTISVLHYEPEERTNGWATVRERHNDDSGIPWDGYIVLAGKRIPPHPAMTRYLVAHEYGHHVEYDLLRRRGCRYWASDVADEYRVLRGLGEPLPYGGRTWHLTAGEVIANDFRVAVCGVEPEFWPHPTVPHPTASGKRLSNKIRRWWDRALA